MVRRLRYELRLRFAASAWAPAAFEPRHGARPTGRHRASKTPAAPHNARLDATASRWRARPKHHRPDRPETGPGPATASGRAADTDRNGASLPNLSTSSASFLTRVLGQAMASDGLGGLQRHRDGAAIGSDAYRRGVGEPAVYPTGATVFRLLVSPPGVAAPANGVRGRPNQMPRQPQSPGMTTQLIVVAKKYSEPPKCN